MLYYLAALLLVAAYRIQTQVPADNATLIWIALIPSVGWGMWRREQLVAELGASAPPLTATVLGRMGTLHALVLAASLVHVLVLVFGDWTIHDPVGPDSIANRSNNAAAMGFDFLISGVEAMFGMMVFFGILFFYCMLFFFASVLPWLLGSSIRNSHQRERLRALEPDRRAKG